MRLIVHAVSLIVLLGSIFADGNFDRNDLNELLKASANHAQDKPATVVFLNYFDHIPLSHFPTKRLGPTHEVPPNRRFLLPDIAIVLINTTYSVLAVALFFHLLRRFPIDHNRADIFDVDKEDEARLIEMRGNMKSEPAQLYFYQRWTNHVATSLKLFTTFQRDFGTGSMEPATDVHVMRASRESVEPKIEKMRLRKQSSENENDI